MIQETLEGVPSGGSIYTPAKMDILLNQIKMKMANLYKKQHGTDEQETYSASDRKTINNHLEKAKKYAESAEILKELQNVRMSGTYREKINLLHSIVLSKTQKGYSQRECSIIHSLFLKQYKTISLDMQLGGSENDSSYTNYDLISDNKLTKPDDFVVWSSFFRDEFNTELDKDSLEKFINCLFDHFSRYPFDIDSKNNLVITRYSKNILFSTFCSVAQIQNDNELRAPFMVLLQRSIDNINRSGR